jgi:hypothetical protein
MRVLGWTDGWVVEGGRGCTAWLGMVAMVWGLEKRGQDTRHNQSLHNVFTTHAMQQGSDNRSSVIDDKPPKETCTFEQTVSEGIGEAVHRGKHEVR